MRWRASYARRLRQAELYETVPEAKNLSVVLRYKQTAGLRKVHLFLLARAWRYASDLWRAPPKLSATCQFWGETRHVGPSACRVRDQQRRFSWAEHAQMPAARAPSRHVARDMTRLACVPFEHLN